MSCVYVVVFELSRSGLPDAAYAYASVHCNDRTLAIRRVDARLALFNPNRTLVSAGRVMHGMEARMLPAWVPLIEASRSNRSGMAFVLRTSLQVASPASHC